MKDASGTWSKYIKISKVTIFDKLRLCFKPLFISETENGTAYYKVDSKNKIYIYDIYMKRD